MLLLLPLALNLSNTKNYKVTELKIEVLPFFTKKVIIYYNKKKYKVTESVTEQKEGEYDSKRVFKTDSKVQHVD